MSERAFLRRADAEHVTGLSISTLYRLAKSGDFPKPIKLGARASAWNAAEVAKWVADRIAARDEESAA